MGGTATLWRGTAFDCPLVGSEITLRHSQFASNQAFRACNNGDIIGSSIGVENGCYTSQLNVTIRASLNNRTVQCAFTSSAGTSIISESLLSVISGNLFSCTFKMELKDNVMITETNLPPPPDNIHLADAQPGKLTFNWTSSTSNSSTLQYDIASDCGTCPTVANMTTATCSNLQVSTNTSLCHFRVSTLACNLAGFLSPPTAITLKGTLYYYAQCHYYPIIT